MRSVLYLSDDRKIDVENTDDLNDINKIQNNEHDVSNIAPVLSAINRVSRCLGGREHLKHRRRYDIGAKETSKKRR
jgi:hypothetical protein